MVICARLSKISQQLLNLRSKLIFSCCKLVQNSENSWKLNKKVLFGDKSNHEWWERSNLITTSKFKPAEDFLSHKAQKNFRVFLTFILWIHKSYGSGERRDSLITSEFVSARKQIKIHWAEVVYSLSKNVCVCLLIPLHIIITIGSFTLSS